MKKKIFFGSLCVVVATTVFACSVAYVNAGSLEGRPETWPTGHWDKMYKEGDGPHDRHVKARDNCIITYKTTVAAASVARSAKIRNAALEYAKNIKNSAGVNNFEKTLNDIDKEWEKEEENAYEELVKGVRDANRISLICE